MDEQNTVIATRRMCPTHKDCTVPNSVVCDDMPLGLTWHRQIHPMESSPVHWDALPD
jgi:hypothetical protein